MKDIHFDKRRAQGRSKEYSIDKSEAILSGLTQKGKWGLSDISIEF